MTDGDITKKADVRAKSLGEYLEWDSYQRWIAYNEYLHNKELEAKNRTHG